MERIEAGSEPTHGPMPVHPSEGGVALGLGLELLQLTANILDRLVQLLHPVVEMGFRDGLGAIGVEARPGAAVGLEVLGPALQAGEPQDAALTFGLTPAFRFREEPPGQSGRSGHSTGDGTDQQRAAAGA